MSFLVDTDRVVDWLKGRDDAKALLADLLDDGLAISVVTYAEIYEGIYRSSNPKSSEAEFQAFLRGARVLGISRAVARRFALLRGDLRARGLLLPMADILIAATALQHGLTLITRNIQDFERFPGLQLR